VKANHDFVVILNATILAAVLLQELIDLSTPGRVLLAKISYKSFEDCDR
jgi:hypothetical protein